MVNSIDGATALKLDESYEIKNSEEQNALINSFESNEESQMLNEALKHKDASEDIPSGVSIESASYIENSGENIIQNNTPANEELKNVDIEEEYTPKLFSEEGKKEESEFQNTIEDEHPDQLFDQDTNEDEDFEIPAFLRRQKF